MEAGTKPAQLRGPLFEPTQEIRFAVVLYGGVSLAIYINGIAQELLHLVRATAPDRPSADVAGSADVFTAVPEPTGTEAVYRKLGQILAVDQVHPLPDDASAEPIRTRFVVDILSGSSAGGLNALFLGKALANEQEIDGLKALWTGEADIAKLVNDGESLAGLQKLPLTDPPRSILNSSRLYWKLLQALTQMDAGGESPPKDSKYVDELDCWITATDIHGLHVPIKLYDDSVDEKRHRSVFRFLYRSSHASGDPADIHSDFRRADNPFLAFAGRCTSSFPFAFDPMELVDVDGVLAQAQFSNEYGALGSNADWNRFIGDYVRGAELPLNQRLPFPTRSFGDGGYLDNKPFTWATETISRRRADVPVDRRLIFLEPAPDRIDPNEPIDRPDALANAQDALMTLPRYETIREDIERLLDRNALVSRLRDVGKVVDLIADPQTPGIAPIASGEWADRRLADFEGQTGLVAERGFQWAAYHRLQVAGVLDDLGELVTTLLGFDANSDVYLAVRAIVQAWFSQVYETEQDPRGRTQTSFLLDFDLAYRLRRLNFVDDRVEWMLRQDAEALARALWVFEASRGLQPADWKNFRDALRVVKPQLNDVFVRLRRAGREVRKLRPGTDAGGPVFEALDALDFQGPTQLVNAVLGGRRSPAEAFAQAWTIVSDEPRRTLLTGLADAIANALRPSIEEARAAAAALLAPVQGEPPGAGLARAVTAHYYNRYESYDAVLYPLSYGAAGDSGRVEVIRFSPLDATRLIDEVSNPARRKLGGDSVGHFGGFLKEAWRTNDIMWGRLDAAERLIDTLLPRTVADDVRNGLIRDAHLAIVHEERQSVFPDRGESDGELLDWIKGSFSVDLGLDEEQMLHVAGRGLRVTQDVLGGLGAHGHKVSKLGAIAAPVLSPVLGVMRMALMRPVRVAAWALVAAAAALIAGGDAADAPAAARTGWALLPYVATLVVAFPLLEGLVAGFFRVGPKRRAAPSLGKRLLRWCVIVGAGLWGALLLFVPIALLNDAIRDALSFLPGWG